MLVPRRTKQGQEVGKGGVREKSCSQVIKELPVTEQWEKRKSRQNPLSQAPWLETILFKTENLFLEKKLGH